MVAVLLTMPARFRGRDAYWFIDNVAALSGFIRGNSEASDVDRAAAVAAMFAALLQTRVWFDFLSTGRLSPNRQAFPQQVDFLPAGELSFNS